MMKTKRSFVKLASLKNLLLLLLFLFLIPAFLRAKGSISGFAAKRNSSFNIQPEKLPGYAAYLVEMIYHYKAEEGVEFDYISPFNEPQWDWDNGSQQGTPVHNRELFEYMGYLSDDLTICNARSWQWWLPPVFQMNRIFI